MHQQELASGEKFRVTFSGIAEYPENGMELEALYRSAGATLSARRREESGIDV